MNGEAQKRILFRAMMEDEGMPAVLQSARGLGVRSAGANPDVYPDEVGNVHPGHGMSVAPDDPLLLPPHRRPPEFFGSGTDPVWQVADSHLPEELAYRATSLTHGQVEPSAPMHLEDFRHALAGTRAQWSRSDP